ncbi:probable serine/threonine-protein kinase DDB_G0282963 [Condylostylus longicornis]|uniref:probable serine/threonine-protein kinase DDB_G0282963 n=1 Tax=Condylostylus longicornis TaxID=2530218 RepID=UPI00244E5885|nr:probable serine/threonine-protein kinase DDB_G0282963 [Condylostylus longicornis]
MTTTNQSSVSNENHQQQKQQHINRDSNVNSNNNNHHYNHHHFHHLQHQQQQPNINITTINTSSSSGGGGGGGGILPISITTTTTTVSSTASIQEPIITTTTTSTTMMTPVTAATATTILNNQDSLLINNNNDNCNENTNNTNSFKLHTLKLRKIELEQLLNEKTKFLQKIQNQEAEILSGGSGGCGGIGIGNNIGFTNNGYYNGSDNVNTLPNSNICIDSTKIRTINNNNKIINDKLNLHNNIINNNNQVGLNSASSSSFRRNTESNSFKDRSKCLFSASEHPIKSSSLHNFDVFSTKDDADDIFNKSDLLSVSSFNSENSKTKQKEKQWFDSSLDGPIIRADTPNHSNNNILQTSIAETHLIGNYQVNLSPSLSSSPQSLNIIQQQQQNELINSTGNNTLVYQSGHKLSNNIHSTNSLHGHYHFNQFNNRKNNHLHYSTDIDNRNRLKLSNNNDQHLSFHDQNRIPLNNNNNNEILISPSNINVNNGNNNSNIYGTPATTTLPQNLNNNIINESSSSINQQGCLLTNRCNINSNKSSTLPSFYNSDICYSKSLTPPPPRNMIDSFNNYQTSICNSNIKGNVNSYYANIKNNSTIIPFNTNILLSSTTISSSDGISLSSTSFPPPSSSPQPAQSQPTIIPQLSTSLIPGTLSNKTIMSTSPDLRMESPKNVTVVQEATFMPYKEVSKPFEMSDFYKYSTKFRQKDLVNINYSTQNSNDNIYDKNAMSEC